jgi:hypothetical protein
MKGLTRMTNMKLTGKMLLLLIFLGTVGIYLFNEFREFRIFIAFVIGIIVIVIVISYWRKSHKRSIAEPYYVRSKCTICGHEWNRIRYLKGDKPYGALVVCDNCGNKYRHNHSY